MAWQGPLALTHILLHSCGLCPQLTQQEQRPEQDVLPPSPRSGAMIAPTRSSTLELEPEATCAGPCTTSPHGQAALGMQSHCPLGACDVH